MKSYSVVEAASAVVRVTYVTPGVFWCLLILVVFGTYYSTKPFTVDIYLVLSRLICGRAVRGRFG